MYTAIKENIGMGFEKSVYAAIWVALILGRAWDNPMWRPSAITDKVRRKSK